MTAFVLDASVTAAWLLPDAASEHTRRLYALIRRDEVEPQAPNLWHWECHNILATGVNSGRIPAASVEGLWGVLEAIRHRVELHELAPAQHKAVLDVDEGREARRRLDQAAHFGRLVGEHVVARVGEDERVHQRESLLVGQHRAGPLAEERLGVVALLRSRPEERIG